MEKVELARKRNWFKLRLLGAEATFYPNRCATPNEIDICKEIIEKIDLLLMEFKEGSMDLGLKPIDRCHFCGKKANNKIRYGDTDVFACEHHIHMQGWGS